MQVFLPVCWNILYDEGFSFPPYTLRGVEGGGFYDPQDMGGGGFFGRQCTGGGGFYDRQCKGGGGFFGRQVLFSSFDNPLQDCWVP